MNITDFFDYVPGRDGTRDLALELVSAYQVRTPRRVTLVPRASSRLS